MERRSRLDGRWWLYGSIDGFPRSDERAILKNFLLLLALGLLLAACDVNGVRASNPAASDSAASPLLLTNNALQQPPTATATNQTVDAARTPLASTVDAQTMLAAQQQTAAAILAEEQLLLSPMGVMSETQTFSQVDDFRVQYRELVDYIDSANRPGLITQVNLKTQRKISQYTDINSFPAGYGKNACGLVAAAAALGGDNWVPLVADIARAAGDHYQPVFGIQPSYFVAALGQTFGTTYVRARNGISLGDLYQELAAGNVVIVDVKLNDVQNVPSAQSPNLAHFARVLGIDVDRHLIYLENTVRGDAYWTVSLRDFWGAWQQPETSASLILDQLHAEDVTRWAVVIAGELVGAKRSG